LQESHGVRGACSGGYDDDVTSAARDSDSSGLRRRRRFAAWTIALGAGFVLAAGLLGGVGCSSTGALEVRVVDGDRPVPAAMVTLQGRIPIVGETFPVHATTPSDGRAGADGIVTFENVDSGGYRLFVGHEDFVRHDEPDVRVHGGERTVHVVSLRRGAQVHGRLVDASGAPMPGEEVSETVGGATSDTVKTDRSGRFLTRATEPGVPIVLRLHAGAVGHLVVAAAHVDAPTVGVNDIGDVRVLDTETVLRFDGEMPRHADPAAVRVGWPLEYALKAHGSFAPAPADGVSSPCDFEMWLGDGNTLRIAGLPDGSLTWTLEEVRVGNMPTYLTVAEGRSALAGRRREVAMRPSAGTK
jgi:hypothetical protein